MKKIILSFVLLLPNLSLSQSYKGDLVVRNLSSNDLYLKFEMVSLPYEGKTSSPHPNNREDLLYNGTFHRSFKLEGALDEFQFVGRIFPKGEDEEFW